MRYKSKGRSMLRPYGIIFVLLCLPLAGLAANQEKAAPSPLAQYESDLKYGMEYKRILTLQALGRKHTPEAYGLIIQTLLHDKSKPVRFAAQQELVNIEDPRIIPAILKGLQDPERYVRLASIDALALVRDTSAAALLVRSFQAEPKDTELVIQTLEDLRSFVYRMEPPEGLEASLAPLLNHGDYRVRLTALAILGIVGRPASLPPLMDCWEKADNKTRIRLADAFANIGRVGPVPLLLKALDDGPKEVKIHCLYALAQIQSFTAAAKIREVLLKDTDARVRMACLYALVEIPEKENVAAILKIMDTDDPTVLHWSAYALAQLGATAAVPELEKKLKHPASLVRSTAATALGELQAKASEPTLLALLHDPREETEVKLAAAKSLMRLGNRQGAAIFWEELQKPKLPLEVRLTLALALGSIREEAYREKLAAWLGNPDFELALSGALGLGVMADSRAQPLLLKALDHGYPNVRRYAILGLEGLRNQAVMTALANTAADDLDPLVRILCASSLVAAGYTDFRVLLWNALDDEHEDLRSEAVQALGRSADALTWKQLKWYLRREPSVPVRQTLQRLLREQRNER
jgi:HEAT repeat protein